jgi:hypothetical protein
MCAYLEDYVETTAKMQKSQAKDYEKILKVGVFSRGARHRRQDRYLTLD